ncbi:MAG TPA: vitamin K epoxide reductase family protein [Terracidiphilus sp.]|nr:vitamin K epoxide reductase family protein [Terracidiphilus sp.]
MRYVILVLAVAGVVVSALALQLHYSTGTAPCDINEHWDCGIVNHSSFAVIANIPVAAIGIAGYLVLGILSFMRLRFATFLAAFIGFLFAFRLSMIEQYGLGVWCLYCAISQTIIAVILLLSIGWFAAEYFALVRAARKAST